MHRDLSRLFSVLPLLPLNQYPLVCIPGRIKANSAKEIKPPSALLVGSHGANEKVNNASAGAAYSWGSESRDGLCCPGHPGSTNR